MSEDEVKTWGDLAQQVEDPWEPLEADPVRWDPISTQKRMEKITNALLPLYRDQGTKQETISKLGTRSGDEYKKNRSELYVIESKITALEKKWNTLKNRGYNKNQEFKHTG